MTYPFRQYAMTVPRDWIDFNDHMNARYYGLIAYDAHIAFIRHLGLDKAYRDARHCSTAVVESHICYERELLEGDRVEVVSWLIAVDKKRMHSFHEMLCPDKGYRVAVSEQLDIHIDLATRKAASFPEDIHTHLTAVWQIYRQWPRPRKAGRGITLKPR